MDLPVKDQQLKTVALAIRPPKIEVLQFDVTGTAPLVMAAFSHKAQQKMMSTQQAGSQARSKKVREARNFSEDMEGAIHYAEAGWIGFPASAFRAAAISACRLVGFKMTLAKLAIFVQADGIDKVSGQPLVKLIAGKPEQHVAAVRNSTGVADLRSRPMWRKWGFKLRVEYDADIFSAADVANLMARIGRQVGIGEGRADSRDSAGLGWGSFTITAS